MLRNYRLCILCGVAAAVIALMLMTPSSARAADGPVSFIGEVAPILKENCFACHDAKKKAGKYDMTTFEKLMAGGDDGEAIVPGKPADSDFHSLMVTDEQRRMPPRDKGNAVAAAKADIVKKWIAEGAKLDAGIDPKADLVAELRKRWQPPSPPKEYMQAWPVNAIAFSPDGQSLVAGGFHELTVWDFKEAKLLKRIRTRTERAYGLAFLPNGLLAVAGGRPGQEGDLRLYDLASGDANQDGTVPGTVLVKHIFDTDDAILCLALSYDGERLAAGGTDRLIRVWNVKDPRNAILETTIENHADWVLGVTFTKDGKFLYSAGRDRTAKVWDFAKKESILTIPEHQSIVYGVAASSDGSRGFSVGADKMLRAWKPVAEAKPSKNGAIHTDEVFKVLMHPSKNVLFTAGADKTVRSWEATEKFPLLKRFEGFNDQIFSLALSKDGNLVAAGSFDGEIRVWNSNDGTLVKAFPAGPGYRKPAAK